MSNTSGENLQTILSHSNGDLAKILQVAKKIQVLNELLQNELPKDLQQQVRLININQGKLILEVSNSSFASKLHYMKSELLYRLRKLPEFSYLKSASDIEHKIAQKIHLEKQTTPEPSDFQLSEQTTQSLISCIESASNDKLKKTLEKFLQHYGKL
ncbi:MAG: Dna[CI] antecedent, DciA [Gammaproteobacteria bacterium]|nr:Dna[CI] antecedent, DciA [Gammaproteobacteria bacterium]